MVVFNMKEFFMDEALEEARKALYIKEVPVGAVIVRNNEIVARAHNLKETLKDPTAHAEILAIKRACESLNKWRLTSCEMYVTLEPCAMCASAIAQARVNRLYIGTFDPTAGACGSVINVLENPNLNYNIQLDWMYNTECSKLLKEFFMAKR